MIFFQQRRFLLLLSLLLLATKATSAWVTQRPTPTANSRIIPRGTTKKTTIRYTNLLLLLHIDPSAVTDLVQQGLETTATNLGGDPSTAVSTVTAAAAAAAADVSVGGSDDYIATAATATVTADNIISDSSKSANMMIDDATILFGGGLATIFLGGLAAFFNLNNNDEKNSNKERTELTKKGSQLKIQATTTATTSNENQSTGNGNDCNDEPTAQDKPEIVNALDTSISSTRELSSGKQTQIDKASVKTEVEQDTNNTNERRSDPVLQDAKQRGLLLQRILDEKSQLLQHADQNLRRQKVQLTSVEVKLQETQAQLAAVTRSNQKLYGNYQQEKARAATLQEELMQSQWKLTESQFSTEEKLQEMYEANRELEDKFELEQNEKKRRTSALRETEWALDKTTKQYAQTQRELKAINAQLNKTQGQVERTQHQLEELQDNNQSLRKLTGNIWKLSKERAKRRVEKIKRRVLRRD